MKFESEFYHFHSRKCNLKMSSTKMEGGGGGELSVKCLLHTSLGIGAHWYEQYSHGRDSLIGVLFLCILYHVLYCTIDLSRTNTRLKMYLVISCGIKYKKISLSLSAFYILCYAGRFVTRVSVPCIVHPANEVTPYTDWAEYWSSTTRWPDNSQPRA